MPRLLLLALLLLAAGCRPTESPPDGYVARVGDQYLTEAELSERLGALHAGTDSAEARRQFVAQWVTQALLYREAQERGLAEDETVQRRLEETRRSLLVSLLVGRVLDESEVAPTEADVTRYYQRHREALALREPYLHVRHLVLDDAETAAAARRDLRELARAEAPDSIFATLAQEHVPERADEAVALASALHPASDLFPTDPLLRQTVERLGEGQVSAVLSEGDSLFHVVQLARRVPAGTEPEQAWVEPEIRERLAVATRKQVYAQHVQRLRREAAAHEALDVPETNPSQ